MADNEIFIIDDNEPVFTTGVVVRLTKIPVWVLKQLDVKQIISPPREERRARLYSRSQLTQIFRIWQLMEKKGLGLKGIEVILEMQEELNKEQR